MAKQFNITGSCNPNRHYMVDSPDRFQRIKAMIDAGDYFTINRGRQFGKTTTLNMIWRQLSDPYLVIPLSFEGIGDTPFSNASNFVSTFCSLIHRYLVQKEIDEQYRSILNTSIFSFDELSETLTRFCKSYPKPVVLMIDEVDKSQYIYNQRLDMEHVIKRFSDFLHEEFRKEDGNFLEQQGRLLSTSQTSNATPTQPLLYGLNVKTKEFLKQ